MSDALNLSTTSSLDADVTTGSQVVDMMMTTSESEHSLANSKSLENMADSSLSSPSPNPSISPQPHTAAVLNASQSSLPSTYSATSGPASTYPATSGHGPASTYYSAQKPNCATYHFKHVSDDDLGKKQKQIISSRPLPSLSLPPTASKVFLKKLPIFFRIVSEATL